MSANSRQDKEKSIQVAYDCVGCGAKGSHTVNYPPECSFEEALDTFKKTPDAYLCDSCQIKAGLLEGGETK